MDSTVLHSMMFHVAFPVSNIPDTKAFYVDGLGCGLGRENRHCVILNLGGNQLVAHMTQEPLLPQKAIYPRHFGLIFSSEADWQALLDRAIAQGLRFRETAKRRFPGLPLEHMTFFLEDPFYNVLEFKYYVHPEAIFGSQDYEQIGDRDVVSGSV